MFGYGFRAAPLLMGVSLALSIGTAMTMALYPYGFKVAIDAAIDGDRERALVGVVLAGGLIAAYWYVATLDANVGFGLTDRVNLYVTSRIVELINGADSIEHFQRPEYAKELDLIAQHRNLLVSAPRQTLVVLQTLVRSGTMVLLLGRVHAMLLLLPLFGSAPALAQAKSVRIRQRSDEAAAEDRRLADELFGLVTTAASSKEIRIYGLDEELARIHEERWHNVYTRTSRSAIVGAGLTIVGWVVFVVAFVIGIGLVLREAIRGNASAGDVVLAVVLAQQVRLLLAQLAETIGQLLTSIRTAQRFLWLEDFATTHRGSGTIAAPERLVEGIRLEGVAFRYPGTDVDVLRSLDLHLPAGASVAIVGENGAGKSTLVQLLSRLYDPTAGRILVDGFDLRDVDIASWRRRVASTMQDFVSFELVARETVGIGDLPMIDDEPSVLSAVERADAKVVIETLDQGLDTQLGRTFAGGRDLSGGQWQRLALARGVMRRDPLVLVLDEPSASLDSESEHRLFERYVAAARAAAERSGTVTILVSHRFSTVLAADMIVVLGDGGIIEAGSHGALMASGGSYAEMFRLQASAYA